MAALQSTSAGQRPSENGTFSPLKSGYPAQGVATQKVLGGAGRRSSGPATHHGVGEFVLEEEDYLLIPAKEYATLREALQLQERGV